MLRKPAGWVVTVAIAAALIIWLWPRRSTDSTVEVSVTATAAPRARPAAPQPSANDAVEHEHHELADKLNDPAGTIQQDLRILHEVFATWLTNFPREGNPVGENAEITAALAGKNRLNLALIEPRHRAINARGELVDRWGTPFRLHQLSGTKMEVRSAGPDRRFSTPDDVTLMP